MANWFTFGNTRPLGSLSTGLPNVGNALVRWFQPVTFEKLTKETVAYQVVEKTTPLNFRGVVQPLSQNELSLKSEGQRDWEWLEVHADPSLVLLNDDVVIYKTKQYRVMSSSDYSAYGYLLYHICEDYRNSGPEVIP